MPISALDSGVFVSEEAQYQSTNQSLETQLKTFGLSQRDWREAPLVIEPGVTVSLAPAQSCPLFLRLSDTRNLDEFKQWVGVPNALIESGRFQPPADLPRVPPSRLEKDKDGLSAAELADLKRARDYFLFGRSDLVEDYRAAIVMHYSPFEVALYAGREVEIMPGASIEVIDSAAILLIDRLIIHPGGNLKLFTPAKVRVNTLHKPRV